MYYFIRLVENIVFPFRVLKGWLGRIFQFGGRTPSLSLAGKVSLAFWFCFMLLITAAFVNFIFGGQTRRFLVDEWGWVNFLLYYLIATLCAVGVYWGIRLATLEKPSLYPEIDQCWNAMDQWRTEQNLNWLDFRRYLVLGSDLEISKAMHAEMPNRKIGPMPSGPNEWMHWFGNTENLYVHLKKVCNLSVATERAVINKRGGVTPGQFNTLQASEGVPVWSAEGFADTMHVSHDANAPFGDSVSGGFGGSLDPADSLDPYSDMSSDVGTAVAGPSDSVAANDADLDEGDRPSDRLRYLCDLASSRTKGELPFHGVVVTIPFERFNQPSTYKSLTASIKEDLLELRKRADVAFPVVFCFCSMEQDSGFPKLQTLLGRERSSTGRFGAGCQPNDVPTIKPDNLQQQVARTCITFETWVFNRWKKSSQISRAAQNKELFKLVVRVRNEFQPRLQYLLEETLQWSVSEAGSATEADLILAGCYFASTGSSSSDRGFLMGMFSKCEEFAEVSSFGETVLSRDRLYGVLGTLLFAISISMMLAIVSVAVWKSLASG